MRCLLPAAVLLAASAVPCGDFVHFIGEDIHSLFDAAPLLTLGTGALLAGGALQLENPSGNRGFMGDGFLEDCSEVCDHAFGLPLIAGAGLVWAGGAVMDEPGMEEAGQMLTEGLLLTYGAAGVLKLAVGRERPDGSNSRSFPSVHAAGTACVAAIVWDRWGPGAGIPAAAVAGFTALSRITLGKHYPSDVIAGAAIGLSVGLAVAHSHDDADENTPGIQPALKIYWFSDSGLGIGF